MRRRFDLDVSRQREILAKRRRDRVCERLFAWTQGFLAEFARRPWNEEGVCGEGPGYGVGTLLELVEAQPIIAACTGASLDETFPAPARKVMRYIQHVRSTWDSPVWEHRPHFLGLSDGSEYHWATNAPTARFRRLTVLAAAGRDQMQPRLDAIGNRNDLQAVSVTRGERRDLILFGNAPTDRYRELRRVRAGGRRPSCRGAAAGR